MSSAPDLPLEFLQGSPPETPVKTNNENNEASADDARGLPPVTVTEAEASSDNHGSVLSDNNRNVEVAAASSDDATKQKVYHTGWRLHALTSALCLSLLLSTLETTIVSTALVSIVDALQGFNMAGWIVTSYLVTYTGFLIIYSKLSDIFGCKLMLLLAITIFTIFSMACGASDSMVPLIVFRAFQGMGGSGIYSLSTIMVPLMVPPEKYATYISIMSSTFILSSVLGPILGGAITDHTTWRWVFYFNGPGGALAAVLLAFSVPFNFPYGESDRFFHSLASKQMWKRVDFVGMVVSLAASILIIFALEQGGVAYPWGSGAIVSTFVLSGVLWIAFVAWERLLSKKRGVREPMFPWSLVHNRFVMGLLLNGFFTGFPFMAALINIPQRFQTVNMTSAINAGIRTLPLLLLSPLATAVNGILVSKLGVPPLYTLFLGGSLQTIGVGLYSSLKSSTSIASAQYGYEAIMGLGFGFNLSTILMMVPLVVTEKDLAVTMGSVTQIRVLGGTIGLAVCSALLINHIKREAVKFLTAEQVAGILLSSENIGMLSPETQSRTRVLYADAYSEQMRVMLYFSIASILSLVLLVERQPRKAPTKPERAG
ncbi:major facilitator superfamily transporter [Fusarium mexicanum]|uniref:Major facilitator superfamily transporter n=1 Tax=Fusarium mexicanum TaxID=751941 RepID=A0A8H5IP73_9HYPO|nr:major facilitator superfamily transporter [Fusarium mexicanum]